jgi:hypothetical protein
MTDDEYREAKKLINELGGIEAAKASGVSRATFYRRLRSYEQAQAAAPASPEPPAPSGVVQPGLEGIDWSAIQQTQREAEQQRRIDNFNATYGLL